MTSPAWTGPHVDIASGWSWYHCNACDSRDEQGKPRKYRCRSTNPKTFNLCDKEVVE
jgi:hypothetical protein